MKPRGDAPGSTNPGGLPSPNAHMSFLTRDPISIDGLLAETASPECGGTCVFLGTVRNGAAEQGLAAIEYSGFEQMVEAELERILADVRERWPGARAAVRHRLGFVRTGEASIGISVGAPHRADAFAACRHVIEAVKHRVPVWKKEMCQDGTTRWVEPE